MAAAAITVSAWYFACATTLLALRWIDPPTTTVQIQRRVESWSRDRPYVKQATFVPLERIDADLRWAVIAAEDNRFHEHRGIDWQALDMALDERAAGRRARGASTITQQLVKNLFFTTHRSFLRKVAEVPLAYTAELLLPKDRILELYLNAVEWGDGIYGAEAAARHHYDRSAARLGRDRSARLAACLPDPRRRVPVRMDRYSAVIRERMTALGH